MLSAPGAAGPRPASPLNPSAFCEAAERPRNAALGGGEPRQARSSTAIRGSGGRCRPASRRKVEVPFLALRTGSGGLPGPRFGQVRM